LRDIRCVRRAGNVRHQKARALRHIPLCFQMSEFEHVVLRTDRPRCKWVKRNDSLEQVEKGGLREGINILSMVGDGIILIKHT
jgi:hypothetical protein